MKDKLFRNVVVAELLLLVPLIAPLFTDEFQWNAFDFAIASILLAGIGIAGALVWDGIQNKSLRTIVGIFLAGIMVLAWAELAVGLSNTPFAGS